MVPSTRPFKQLSKLRHYPHIPLKNEKKKEIERSHLQLSEEKKDQKECRLQGKQKKSQESSWTLSKVWENAKLMKYCLCNLDTKDSNEIAR